MILKKSVNNNVEKSIFDLISESIDEKGSLPRDFEFPDDYGKEGTKFASGAMDGICMYHMPGQPLKNIEKKRLKGLIELAGKGFTNGLEKSFADFCKEHRAITIPRCLILFLHIPRTKNATTNILQNQIAYLGLNCLCYL